MEMDDAIPFGRTKKLTFEIEKDEMRRVSVDMGE